MGYPSYILANVVDNEMERGWREMSPACPRCGSSNTKFCYYNNYSLTQPRYFCKGCRRYWTKGGSLRNVPVGGGCRKSRRSRSSSLRLTTSSNHLGITSRNVNMHGSHHHHHHHQHEGDHEHGGGHGNLVNNMGDSSTSSEAPAIDLASVYANFLNQKPQSNPPPVDISSIPDATTIAPTFVDCSNTNDNNDPLSFSQKLPSIPELIMNNNNNHDDIDHHNNQVLFVTEFSRPMMIHDHQHHHEDASSIQHNELGLPPLPGGDSFMSHDHHHQPLTWAASDLDHDHHHHQQHQQHYHHHDDIGNNMQVPLRGLQDLETDSQFSNLFNNAGSWSPLNFPGFETSSSSSKP